MVHIFKYGYPKIRNGYSVVSLENTLARPVVCGSLTLLNTHVLAQDAAFGGLVLTQMALHSGDVTLDAAALVVGPPRRISPRRVADVRSLASSVREELVLHGDDEPRRAGGPLPAAAPAQLPIDSRRLVQLGADYVKPQAELNPVRWSDPSHAVLQARAV